MADTPKNKRPLGTRWCSTGYASMVLGLALTVIGLAGARFDLLSPLLSFSLFGIGGLILLIAALSSGIGLALSKGTAGASSAARTWSALALSVLVIGVSMSQRPNTSDAPGIHDITTDTANPPAFDAIVALRSDAQNPPEYSGPEAAKQQLAAFPDITTLTVKQPVAATFAAARQAAEDLGWKIVAANESTGLIEATATTQWFRFKDDVVIRLRPNGNNTVVDVRSKSRVGRGDMGANATRVRAFMQKIRSGESG